MYRHLAAMAVVTALLAATQTQTFAETLAEANCAKFISVHGEKQALFNGYIYGFVAGRIGYKDVKRLTSVATKVRALTVAYCRKNPNEPVVKVIDAWTVRAIKTP